MFIRQTQPFLKRFVNETSSKVPEKRAVRKSLAPKAEAKKAGSANNDADENPRPHLSRQSQLSTRINVEVHVTHFGKTVAYGFVKFSKRAE